VSDKIQYYTIEPGGRGATYRRVAGFTVYGHGTYPRHSVLAGQPLRRFEDHFDTLEEARAKFPTARLIPGTTYAPADLSHLPDDGD
jgi:hypothetical protein